LQIPAEWSESKYELRARGGGLRGSRAVAELAVGSRLPADRVARFYSRAIRERVSGRLLDLGCGKAPLLGYYSEFVESATLVDWGNSLHENPILDIVADLNQPLPIHDEYDTVILSDVLEHIAEPQGLMNEIGRLLKSGGFLLLNVPFYYPLHEEPFDFHRYTRHALVRMCDLAGLEVVEVHSIGGVPEVMIDLTSKITQAIPGVGRALTHIFQALGGWSVTFGLGKLLSKRTADRFPLGYTLVAVKRD